MSVSGHRGPGSFSGTGSATEGETALDSAPPPSFESPGAGLGRRALRRGQWFSGGELGPGVAVSGGAAQTGHPVPDRDRPGTLPRRSGVARPEGGFGVRQRRTPFLPCRTRTRPATVLGHDRRRVGGGVDRDARPAYAPRASAAPGPGPSARPWLAPFPHGPGEGRARRPTDRTRPATSGRGMRTAPRSGRDRRACRHVRGPFRHCLSRLCVGDARTERTVPAS